MTFRVHLSEKDQQRLGCGPALELDLLEISITDLGDLSERLEFEPEDWPDVMIGEIPFEQAGSPDARAVPPKWQKQAAVWLALHQNGHDITWEQAGQVAALRVRYTSDAPGKDEPESPSPTSGDSGTPPSATSSARRRRKSTP